MSVLFFPGRTTFAHERFLSDFPEIHSMSIIGVDVTSADLMYSSHSKRLIFCSGEKYMLELHRFLSVVPSYRYVREKWENEFSSGQNWQHRCRALASFNSRKRSKILRNWMDMSTYYCILCMSSFNVHYKRWKLVGEHIPCTPDYESIHSHAIKNASRILQYKRCEINTLPTTRIDNNTLIYFHIPHQYGYYGHTYQWNKSRLLHTLNELSTFAQEGYRVCISGLYDRRGLRMYKYEDLIPSELFYPVFYPELKANRSTEVYYIANF